MSRNTILLLAVAPIQAAAAYLYWVGMGYVMEGWIWQLTYTVVYLYQLLGCIIIVADKWQKRHPDPDGHRL